MTTNEKNTDDKELAFDILSTLTIERILGSGAFGTVFLVRNKVSEDLYALKVIRKSCSSPDFSETSALNELKIFQKIGTHDVPYTTKLYASFQTSDYVFFLMNYFPGGTLGRLVESHGPLTEARAMKISSQILIALEMLHSIGVSHRDLKPDNILIDQDGSVAIADFGISDLNGSVQKWQTNEGALFLWSPELRKGVPCTGVSVDLWSFGLMLHYLISGNFPISNFEYDENNSEDASMSRIDVGLPKNLSGELKSLICSLLNEDFCSRLVDISEIKQHPWYKGLIWDTTDSFFFPEGTMSESLKEMDHKFYTNKKPLDTAQYILESSTSHSSMKTVKNPAFESEVETEIKLAENTSKRKHETTVASDYDGISDGYWTQTIDLCDNGIEAVDFFSYSLDDDVNAIPSFNYISSDIKHFLDQRFCLVRI